MDELRALQRRSALARARDTDAAESRAALGARTLSYAALRRARSTLDDFCRFYLPIHGLTVDDFFLAHMPLLVYVEASIYQLDDHNEVIAGSSSSSAADAGSAEAGMLHVLRHEGVLSEHVQAELDAGRQYWALERALCAKMAAGKQVDPAEVLAASALKSFDYRVLHEIILQLSGKPRSEALMAFMRADEALADIADDLFDYEDDVGRGSFNVLRGLTHALADGAPLALAVRIGELEKEHEARLRELPRAVQRAYCACRRRAMSGGAHSWEFPPIVPAAREAEFCAAWADAPAVAADDAPEAPADADADADARHAADVRRRWAKGEAEAQASRSKRRRRGSK